MKIRSILSVVVILFVGVLLSGCALRHDALFHITDPQNGNTFPLNQPLIIKVRVSSSVSTFNGGDWQFYEWVMWDGNTIISQGSASTLQREFDYALNSPYSGPHYVSVRARAAHAVNDPSSDRTTLTYSDWYNTNEVCFFIGPDAPSDFCSVRTIVQPLTVSTLMPSPTPPTPTATPVTPIPIRPNPHNPGGTNPTGCAALTDQTSCNLAGCSWNPQNSSCSVNP